MGIGARVRDARERRGITLADLAEVIGKDKSVMSRIERGQRNVKSDELALLADRLDVTVDELMGIVPDRDLLAVAFRIGQRAASLEQQQAVRVVQDVLEVEQAAARGQARTKPRVPRPHFEGEGAPEDVGDTAARGLRGSAGLGHAPVADLTELAEELGADVLRVPLPRDVSGLCVRLDGGALIAVDSGQTIGRQRFTLAHEIGHFLLDDEATDLILDDDEYLAHDDATEARANAFAYELLLPEEGLRRVVTDGVVTEQQFAELLFHFNVSQSALRHRLRSLRLIAYESWDELGSSRYSPKSLALRHGYFDDWASGNDFRGQVIPPRRVWSLALDAYEDGRIGLGLLATLRHQDRDELAAELDAQGIVPDFSEVEVPLGGGPAAT